MSWVCAGWWHSWCNSVLLSRVPGPSPLGAALCQNESPEGLQGHAQRLKLTSACADVPRSELQVNRWRAWARLGCRAGTWLWGLLPLLSWGLSGMEGMGRET